MSQRIAELQAYYNLYLLAIRWIGRRWPYPVPGCALDKVNEDTFRTRVGRLSQ